MPDVNPASVGFVLFSPDATTTGLYRDAVTFLEEHGFGFVAYKWVQLSRDDLNSLYQKNRQNSSPSVNHSLVDRLFTLDVSLAGYAHFLGDLGSGSAPALLKQLKGPSDPAKLEPGHLREVLGAGNKVMNFVHTSDTIEETQTEAALFFPPDVLCAGCPTEAAPPTPRSLRSRGSVSIFSTLLAAKSRLLDGCLVTGGDAARSLIERERRLVAVRRVEASRRVAVFDLWKQQAAVIETTDMPPAPKAVFKRLTTEKPAEWNLPALVWDLNSVGVALDSWDRLILDCQSVQGQIL